MHRSFRSAEAAVTGPIAVTGATGGLGGRVARLLAERGVPLRLVVRDPRRAPVLPAAEVVAGSYDDPAGLRAALDGIETLLLVSATEHPDRIALHASAVGAAAAAGVARIVYTSFLGAAPDSTFTFARDHWHTEQAIRGSGAAWVFLRDSLYLDMIPVFVGSDGVIRGPAGDGRVAAVAREDVADVAAAVLVDPGYDGSTLDVTGPEAFSLAEAAAELTRVSGRPTTYHEETLEEAYASRRGQGAQFEVAGWVTTYAAIGAGELDALSETVERVAGHAPAGLADWLAGHPEVVAGLRG
jgi:uncharacterized protein YbjT (DUF2867 family)